MQHSEQRAAREYLIPFLILLLFWRLLAPDGTIASWAIGGVVSAGTILFCRDILFRRSEFPPYTLRTLPRYGLILVRLVFEMIRSNIDVALTVLNPRLPIQPQFVRLSVRYRTEFNRTVQANCITLTPGTISVEVDSESILVHALTDRAAAAVAHNFAIPSLKTIEELHVS